jgi:hypothetical protein
MKLLEIISVGFDVNRSTTDQIFCIRQILEKKWEYNETVHQLFIDFKKAYNWKNEQSITMLCTVFLMLLII